MQHNNRINGLCHSDEASFSSSWVTTFFLISIAIVTISLYRGRSSLHALPIVLAKFVPTTSSWVMVCLTTISKMDSSIFKTMRAACFLSDDFSSLVALQFFCFLFQNSMQFWRGFRLSFSNFFGRVLPPRAL